MTDLARLAEAMASLARVAPDGARLVGIGWATVDTDRTIAGLGALTTVESEEAALGARARVGWLGATALVVLEPVTEGRLAAALARRGEGIACLYLEAAEATGSPRLTALGRPGRLLAHDRPWGPFLLLVDPPV